MTLITWLSSLAVLWTIVVDTRADQVDPLVMAVYSSKDDERRFALLDLSDVNDKNLKLPLDGAEPEYFVLFCGTNEIKGHRSKYMHLFAQRVTKEIDSEARNLKCEHNPSPYLGIYSHTSKSILAYIGYDISTVESFEQGNENTTTNELLAQFRQEFKLRAWYDEYMAKYLEDIKYDRIHNVPLLIEHTVKAHMHSNNYEKECEEIRLNTFTMGSKIYTLDTIHHIQVPGYKWRQLVPMQDLKGIYGNEATCIYFNYLLLHEKAIESLKKIEIFIRDVADRLNEVHVESGTYTPEEEVILQGDEPNQTIIPSIVWKKITRRDGWPDYYTVLAVIHNRKTKRICKHNENVEQLGLPEYNDEKYKTDNEIDTGGMYYCLVDYRINGLLKISGNEFEKPLNLNNPPFMKDDVDPFVIAVYSPTYNKRRIQFVHLTNENDENWELPLDAAKPEYFVLLCGSGKIEGEYNKYSRLIVQRIAKEIDSEARNLKCKHHSLPNIRGFGVNMDFSRANIQYDLDIELWKQKNPNTGPSELLTKFQDHFGNKYTHNSIVFLKITYNRKYQIPELIKHTVKAHMHSNINGKECKEIRLNVTNKLYEEPPSHTLYNIQVPDYQWRQLVPMQDFSDIYVANATCTNLNFLLLHKHAIEGLIKIENFIRDIADVINEVSVVSGTYTPKDEVSLLGNEPNQTIIPSIVWKKITHQGTSTDYYTVLVIIHNRKTKRICRHYLRHFGWPKYNERNENDIGYMYYCFFDKDTWTLLGLPIPPDKTKPKDKVETEEERVKRLTQKTVNVKRFDLENLPFVKDNKIWIINVKSKIEGNFGYQLLKSIKSVFNK